MKSDELRITAKAQEKRTVEFKEAWSELPSSLFETICAFLNRDGGTILLGVNDDGAILGVNPNCSMDMCKNISNLSNNPQKLNPTFLLQPEVIEENGKSVISIQVPSSSQVHKTAGKVFDRSTDGDFELKSDSEISALYLRKSNLYSENIIYPYLKAEHFDTSTIEKAKNLIRNNRSDHPWLVLSDQGFYKQANLYRYDIKEGKEGFTLAALMLFGKEDIIQSTIPSYKIDLTVRFYDTDRYDDRLTIFGNIINAYDDIMAFVAKHLPDAFFIENGQRVSLRDKVFREIVANILIHREYLNPTPTTIVIGRKGIEAKNANRPLRVGVVTLDNYEPHPKNPHIANFFVQLGRAEHLGTGIRNIIKYTKLYTEKEATILDGDTYQVVVPLPRELRAFSDYDSLQNSIQKTIQKKHVSLTALQQKVLTQILVRPTVTRREIAASLGVEDGDVNSLLLALKNKGMVVREGGRKYGRWIVFMDED